jgi:NADH-quinone oxidoreductase subunit J
MDLINFLVVVFSFSLLYSAFMVVTTRNPVHSVLFLILVFCNAAPLLILLGAEFLAFLLVVVYVGAIAVLFLFVVMMLDIRIFEISRRNFISYYPVALSVLGIMGFFLIHVFYEPVQGSFFSSHTFISSLVFREENLSLFATLLYSYFFPHFFLAALILLVAMVGAIVLTFSSQRHSLRQEYYRQVDSSPQSIAYVQKHRSF